MIVVRIVAVIAAFGIVAGGLMQYLANYGYAVLGINNRSSSGYGKTFFAADDKKHGREPL